MDLILTVNGQERIFSGMPSTATLADVVHQLELKADRVAVEVNGTIVSRRGWNEAVLAPYDKLEVVHFVGGGGR